MPQTRVRTLTKYTYTCYSIHVIVFVHATVSTHLHLRKTLSEIKLACDINPKIVKCDKMCCNLKSMYYYDFLVHDALNTISTIYSKNSKHSITSPISPHLANSKHSLVASELLGVRRGPLLKNRFIVGVSFSFFKWLISLGMYHSI